MNKHTTFLLAAIGALWLLAPTPALAQLLGQYCQGDRPAVHVLLVDQTDVYDDIDRQRLFTGVSKIINDLPVGARLDVFAMTDRPGQLTPRFSACVPGCAEGDGRSCRDALVLRHRQSFQGEVVKLVGEFGRNTAETDGSEIARTLYLLGSEYDGRNLKALYVFSDMLENSDINQSITSFSEKSAKAALVNVKRKADPGRSFAGTRILAFGVGKRLGQAVKEARDLEEARKKAEEAEIRVRHIGGGPRPPAPDVKDHSLSTATIKAFTEFWYEYFFRAGAREIDIRLNY